MGGTTIKSNLPWSRSVIKKKNRRKKGGPGVLPRENLAL